MSDHEPRSSVNVEAVIRVHAAQGFGSCSNADQALVTLGSEVERLREALRRIADHDAAYHPGWKHWCEMAEDALDG